jgi:hypothetical protein
VEAHETFRPPREITNRAGLIAALQDAAELEHGLMLQYLFAALSMKRRTDEGVSEAQLSMLRRWERSILEVARQEMAHLGTVCNLLSSIGAAPHFGRPNFPAPSQYYPMGGEAGTPDEFLMFALEPFGMSAINRFVRFEQPDEPMVTFAAVAEPDIRYTSVGDLYRQIEAAFEALQGESLFIGPETDQETDGWTARLALLGVKDFASAKKAIDFIVIEGEGGPDGGETSHWARFKAIRKQLGEVLTADPGFKPARPVLANPQTRAHPEAPGGSTIDDPVSGALCELLNGVYETMILMLMQYFSWAGEPDPMRAELRATIRRLMSGFVRPLGELLTEMPAGPSAPGHTAGPSFEMYTVLHTPTHAKQSWIIISERLHEQARACDELAASPHTAPRLTQFAENLHLAAATIGRALGQPG